MDEAAAMVECCEHRLRSGVVDVARDDNDDEAREQRLHESDHTTRGEGEEGEGDCEYDCNSALWNTWVRHN